MIDPFHVVKLAGDALDQYQRRVKQHLPGRRLLLGSPSPTELGIKHFVHWETRYESRLTYLVR